MALAKSEGRVSVEGLADRFNVTPQTIRKDLNDLCEQRRSARYHGGALLASGIENIGYEARRKLATDEKRRDRPRGGDADPRQCLAVHQYRHHHRGGRRRCATSRGYWSSPITSMLPIGCSIIHRSRSSIAGGVVRGSDGGVVGEAAVDFIRQFKVDYAVIGASAIDDDGALLDFDFREVKVAQAIIAMRPQIHPGLRRMKFERTAPVRIGHISQLDYLVTETEPPAARARNVPGKRCRRRDCQTKLDLSKKFDNLRFSFKRKTYEPTVGLAAAAAWRQQTHGNADGGMRDIAIIGGGINGCGIARDAAGRGLSVLLCETGRSRRRHLVAPPPS